ncbi:MAG: efflux RND transporter periplasmic adaptor subunit [Pseudomonadota bacterium]
MRIRSLLCALVLAVPVAAPAQDAGPGVIVSRATEVEFPLTVEALGTARANESVEIRPQLSETVRAIRFTEGDKVAEGTVLLELEDQQARAAVAQARAALVDSESQYRRAAELFESRAVAASELERLAAQRDADRAAVEAAQARLDDTIVRAPFDGRVGLRNISRGALVTPQTVITTLDDTDVIKVDFDVPETALSLLAEGLPITARSAAWPDEPIAGTVATIDTRVDPISRTVTVRALVDNSAGRLRPGMFLTVELRRDGVMALLIPEQAIVPERSQQFVYVIADGSMVERREIRTGRRRPGSVEIVAGLAAGEIVIVEGTQKVRPGQPATVVRELEDDA